MAFAGIVVQPFVAMERQGRGLYQAGPIRLVPCVVVLPFSAVDAGVGLEIEMIFLDAEAGDESVAVAVGFAPAVVRGGQRENILRYVVPKLDGIPVVG